MKKSLLYVLVGVLALLSIVLIFWKLSRDSGRQAHSVTLTWKPPAPRNGVVLVGYNVYRRTAEGGPFVKIANRVAGPPYEDRLVNASRTYIYAVTTVDQAGQESRFSDEAKAEIP